MHKHGHKKKLWISLCFLIFFLFEGCTPWLSIVSTTPLGKREEGTVLITGCVIIAPTTIILRGRTLRNMCAVLVYQPPGDKKDELEIIWAETDSAGYFALVNMPAGRYAIIKVRLNGLEPIVFYYSTEEKGWNYSSYDEPEIQSQPTKHEVWPEFNGDVVYNFGYLVLVSGPRAGPDCRGTYYESLEELSAFSRLKYYKYYRSPVPQYFIDKYPDSEWTRYLRRLLEHKQE